MRVSTLLDAAGLARSIESAYRDMWRRWCESAAGLRAHPAGAREPLLLHIGGMQRRDGWKILNSRPGPEVDFVGDCKDLSRFAHDSVDQIYASHALERLAQDKELPLALAEFRRVLKPGGIAKISVAGLSAEFLTRYLFEAGFSRVERAKSFAMSDDSRSGDSCGVAASLNVAAYK